MLAIFVPLATSQACRDRSTERRSADAAVAAPAPGKVADGEAILRVPASEPTAFDLVRVADGALLAVGRRAERGGGVRLLVLGAGGERRFEIATAPEGVDAVEVAGASAGSEVAVTWIGRSAGAAVARAAVGDLESKTLSVSIALGDASLSTTERGHVAMGAVPGGPVRSGAHRFVAFVRGRMVPCSESPGGCTEFALHEIEANAATPRRVALSVPAPCGRGIAGFESTGTRWHYGVCAIEDGRATTTVFTIEHSPEYAQAHRLLEGCVPLDIVSLGSRSLLVGRCGSERRAVALGGGDVDPAPIEVDSVQFACEGSVPVLASRGPAGPRQPLTAPADGLAPLLPRFMAVDDSRAVWTGRALLVATAYDGEVVVRRFTCRRGG